MSELVFLGNFYIQIWPLVEGQNTKSQKSLVALLKRLGQRSGGGKRGAVDTRGIHHLVAGVAAIGGGRGVDGAAVDGEPGCCWLWG